MLWTYLETEDTPIPGTKVIVLIVESLFFFVWRLICVEKQVKPCVDPILNWAKNLSVGIYIRTCELSLR